MPDGDDHIIPGDALASWQVGIAAIRMDGVKAGRFLPLPDRPDEIKASPIVDDVRQVGPCLLYNGDSTRITPLLEGMHACVTDPPYELGFMGKSWDSSGVAAAWETWGGVRIALRPGGHLVAFAGSRTYHRIAKAIDDAGFEVRDQIMWIYGSGFPKSLDVSKAIDKAAGAERKVVGSKLGRPGYHLNGHEGGEAFGAGLASTTPESRLKSSQISAPASAASAAWEGWGTALKPAHEPVCFARKPLAEKTVAENVLRWATGAINVDDTRVGSDGGCAGAGAGAGAAVTCFGGGLNGTFAQPVDGLGRWPANVATDGSLEVLEAFPPSARDAIRYFYAAKADKADREFGLDDDAGRGAKRSNFHPTVKPVDLMRWLCRLVTPPGGIVLDPFMGSGSTGIASVREGFRFVGIEQSAEYYEIACKRVSAAVRMTEAEPDLVREISKALGKPTQGELL